MNESQLALASRLKMFPSSTPKASSSSATEMPSSTENMLASRTAAPRMSAS